MFIKKKKKNKLFFVIFYFSITPNNTQSLNSAVAGKMTVTGDVRLHKFSYKAYKVLLLSVCTYK